MTTVAKQARIAVHFKAWGVSGQQLSAQYGTAKSVAEAVQMEADLRDGAAQGGICFDDGERIETINVWTQVEE